MSSIDNIEEPGRHRFANHVGIFSVIVSLVLSLLAISQNPASASASDGVAISCPTGTTFDAATTMCRSASTESVEPLAETSTGCPKGFEPYESPFVLGGAVSPAADHESQQGIKLLFPECVKETDSIEPPEPFTRWECPEGATRRSGSAESMVCEVQVTSTEEVPAKETIVRVCPDGFQLVNAVDGFFCGKHSTPERTDPAQEVTEYKCPARTFPSGKGAQMKCYISKGSKGAALPPLEVIDYRCPEGTIPVGAVGPDLKCKTPAQPYKKVPPTENVTLSCPAGSTKVAGSTPLRCEKTVRSISNVASIEVTTYHCRQDESDIIQIRGIRGPEVDKDHVCKVVLTETADEETITTYSCPEGSVAVDGTSGEGLECRVATSNEVPATITCAGHTVTVNMNNGDKPTKGDDVILGTQGPDKIRSKAGHDIVCGWGGDDIIKSGGGHDTVYGGDGDDTVKAGGGKDTVKGGNGDDVVDGGRGKDRVYGDDGNDILKGGKGRDTLSGGNNTDSCDGGSQKNKIDESCEN